MALVRWNPWHELTSLHSQMDRLFNESLGDGGDRLLSEYAVLPVDIKQTEDQFTVIASVPGFAPDEVEVTFDEGVLTIRGNHDEDVDGRDGAWVRRERRMTSIHRQLVLPAEVQVDRISAGFENGVLTITVPRAQKAQPKRIPVAATSSPSAQSERVIDAPRAENSGDQG